MTRLLFLAAAVACLPLSASAQSFLPVGDDDNCMGCPPTLSSTDGLTEAASKVGETMGTLKDDDPGYGFIWWLATNFSPHIPVDPKCPPPDGCVEDDPPKDDPPSGDPPSGDPPAGDPPAGDPPAGDPPAGDPPAGDPPAGDPPAGGDETTQKSSSGSSSPPTGGGTPPSEPETFELGDRAAALALRGQFESVPDGRLALRGTLEDGSRLRLVSKREASADEGEYVMRFEVLPAGRRARAVPVLVQAIGGKLYARVGTSVRSVRDRVRSDRPRVQRRRGVRG